MNIRILKMMKLPSFYTLVCLFVLLTNSAGAQINSETIHGVSGYDYVIKGELELTFTHSVDYKNGNKQNATYRIKSPVQLSFNLNDLRSFIAKPLDFVGYVENPVIASCGYPCGGGLIDIAQGGIRSDENWMQADVHFVSQEDGVSSEINATGEIYPFMEVFFSIPDFSKELKVGLNQLQFRLFIKGISDSQYHPVRNVKVNSSGAASLDHLDLKSSQADVDKTYNELLKIDKALAEEFKKGAQLMAESSDGADFLPISVTCGSFFGADEDAASRKMSFSEADAEKRSAFETQFERAYFEKLPHIDAMKLINFLIKPSGNYESPFTGSFFSDSEFGAETATYQGKLLLWGNQVRKSE